MPNNRNNKGTNFTNYGDILRANQQSGQRMGGAVAGGLESQAQAVNQDLAQQQQQFQQKFQNSQQDWSNQSALANQLAGLGSQQDWSGIANINNPDMTQAGKNFRNYSYTGPTGLKNASGLQAQAQSATQAGQSAANTQGQQQLLGQYVGGRNYTQGQSQFDQALLNKYGRGQIAQAQKGLAGLGEKVNTAAIGAGTAADLQSKNIQNSKESASKSLLDYLRGGTTAYTAQDPNRVGILGIGEKGKAAEEKDILDLNNALAKDPSDYNDRDKQLLAGIADRFTNRYGINTAKDFYYTQRAGDIANAKEGVKQIGSALNVDGTYLLTPEQQAAATALAKFTGNQQMVAPEQFTDLSKTFDDSQSQLQDIVNTTAGVSQRETEGKRDYWGNEANYWNNLRYNSGGVPFYGKAYDKNDSPEARALQAANARSIQSGLGVIYSGNITPQIDYRLNKTTSNKSAEEQALEYGNSKKLLDFLNTYNPDYRDPALFPSGGTGGGQIRP